MGLGYRKDTRQAVQALHGGNLLDLYIHCGIKRLNTKRGLGTWRRGAGAAVHRVVSLGWPWTCGEYLSPNPLGSLDCTQPDEEHA